MNAWEAIVLVVGGGTVVGILIGIPWAYWSQRHTTKVSTKTDDVVRLDATVVLGWLRTSSPEALRNVVLGLIGLEDSRARQLTSIESKVDAIIDSPYHEARNYLDSALGAGLDTDKGKKYLDKSIHDFQKAAANYSTVAPRRESWACLHLFLLYTALNNSPRAQEWEARGYNAAIQWARQEIRAFNDRRELRRGRWSLLRWSWTLPLLVAAIIVVIHGHFSTRIWKDWQEIVIASGVPSLALFGFIMTFGPEHYRQFVAWRAKALMKDCDQFLNETWKIWDSLSPIPAEVTSFRVDRIDDPETDTGLYIKTFVLRSADPPTHPTPPPKHPTPLVQAQLFGAESPSAVIGWDYYEAWVEPYRLAIARSLFDRIMNTVEIRGLGWVPELRSTCFAFQQPGCYDRVGVDIDGSQVRLDSGQVTDPPFMHSVDFWIKLPVSPDELPHLTHRITHLYAGLVGAWDAANKRWCWVVPTLLKLPDVTRAIELANQYQSPALPT